MKNKKINPNKMVACALVVLAIILVITIVVINVNKNKNQSDVENEIVSEKDKYTRKLSDGTKINTSSKLQETKKVGSFEINNFQFTYSGSNSMCIMLADIKNTSNKRSKAALFEIKLVDDKQNVIETLPGIIQELEPGEVGELNTSVSADYSYAYDAIITEKE